MGEAILLTTATALVALSALIIERIAGYPDALYRLIGHPVGWIGRLIERLDHRLNRIDGSAALRRRYGAVALGLILITVLGFTLPLTLALRAFPGGVLIEAVLASSLLSQRSLRRHVAAVADGLDHHLEAGRAAVSHIVGRDPQRLDASGVARAAIESLAENTSDGVVAPLLWLIVGGLPGIALYKAINTADSMIGHTTARYRDFGWASARLDDLVNLPAARLTGLIVALAAGMRRRPAALKAMRRHAHQHLSPNAGWPEAAMAGALGIRLGGPRRYGGTEVALAWMGDGRTQLSVADIRAALMVYDRALDLVLAFATLWLGARWLVL